MIYLHVPFCGSFCTYCDFYSEICRDARTFNEYADAVVAEILDRRNELSMNMSAPSAVSTLYVGGGTPSVLPLSVLRRIVETLRLVAAEPVAETEPVPVAELVAGTESIPVAELVEASGLRVGKVASTGSATERRATEARAAWRNSAARAAGSFSEFTVEVNPEDIVEKGSEYVSGLIALGVNRISMGIQSFDDGILRWMNRRHDAAGAEKAFRILRECGIKNISVDLIFGLSQLTDELWEDTIGKALDLSPQHISAYQLSIEEGSALARMEADGRYVEASEDQCRRQYDILCRTLAKAGYRHYEISNFAKPGFEAVHNSAYWSRTPYVGLGPGAHSLSGGVRSWNAQTLPHRRPDSVLESYSRDSERLSDEDIRIERIMLPLRTDIGLKADELYSLAAPSTVDALLDEGALVRTGERIRIPEDHFFTSDEIIRELV